MFVARGAALAAAFVAFGALGGACDSTLNLGEGAGDGSAPSVAEDGGAATCADVCDRLILCGLGDPTKRDACLGQCGSARPSDIACVMQSACQDIYGACVAPVVGDSGVLDPFDASDFEEQSEIDECNNRCDTFKFYDCIHAAELSACRERCQTAPRATRNSFNACASGVGSDCLQANDCLTVFEQ
jgi:hypothetical protein